MTDWQAWHRRYDTEPALRTRLRIVQDHIRHALELTPPGPIRVLSLCAGDGRDLLGVLADHHRAKDVSARLIEIDSDLAYVARRTARDADLPGVEVLQGDAGLTSAFVGAAPADLVLACGVFGNVSDSDVERTVRAFPMLCATHGTVIWTRHRGGADLTWHIRRWVTDAGFEEVAFEPVEGSTASVGIARFVSPSVALVDGRRLFTFDESRRG